MFRQQYNIATIIARHSKRRFHDQTKSHMQTRVIRNRLGVCIILIFYYYYGAAVCLDGFLIFVLLENVMIFYYCYYCPST